MLEASLVYISPSLKNKSKNQRLKNTSPASTNRPELRSYCGTVQIRPSGLYYKTVSTNSMKNDQQMHTQCFVSHSSASRLPTQAPYVGPASLQCWVNLSLVPHLGAHTTGLLNHVAGLGRSMDSQIPSPVTDRLVSVTQSPWDGNYSH